MLMGPLQTATVSKQSDNATVKKAAYTARAFSERTRTWMWLTEDPKRSQIVFLFA